MSAEDAFRAGKLDDAVAEQGAVVRAAPLDADARWIRHYGFRPLDLPTLFGGLSR